ncbi:hypothetical protein [Capnocytophaga sp. oral taxon 324]|uniref:hypothetical protein n=1 Tax=Capnocytophaga sp. oral taxon 324 TaxID=712211 RepID=UPI0002A27508|nr:hypothetical protein [Capnocytophaga sp. oral taxon 324]EKY12191.1 hypothetical protein HMPREF9072_02089 [Capnocytophaga sp. oral taxon 324 str. F0483]
MKKINLLRKIIKLLQEDANCAYQNSMNLGKKDELTKEKLKGVVDSYNNVLVLIDCFIENERDFTTDSHE